MKILLVSKAMTVVSTLSKARLLSKWVDLTIVTPQNWPTYVEEKNEEDESYKHYRLKVGFEGRNHFHFYWGLTRVVDDVQPDLIHIDEEHYSFVTFQVNVIAKKRKIKTLCFTWQNIYKRYPFPFSYFERYNLNTCEQILIGNNEAGEVLLRKGFKKPMPYIPQFGVDRDIFFEKHSDKQRFGIESDKFIVGYVGRIVEEKGISTLIHAIAKVKDAQLCIAGTGPYMDVLKHQILKLGIVDRVSILGGYSSTEIAEFISCCDCIALPSLTRENWKEQFGRILVEAMACGVPVIGSNSGEIPKVIGEAGVVFNEQDFNQCAAAIEKIRTDLTFADRIVKEGLKKVDNLFTQDVIVKKTVDVYKNILK